ncbi:hypothetical protein ABIB57_000157 [Devosia sp. UYZn731]|uniref:hypothetical protein n=1 Tax=Devosia sp. UYZn731 TaxID=3156345 RepID=UPI00339169BF
MTNRVQIKGATKGYKRGTVFEIEGLGFWEQTSGLYVYLAQFRPVGELEATGSSGSLKLGGMADWVDVKKVPRPAD